MKYFLCRYVRSNISKHIQYYQIVSKMKFLKFNLTEKPKSVSKSNHNSVCDRLSFTHCRASLKIQDSQTTESKPNSSLQLVIILAWVMAKDEHLEKYRQLWLRRDYDVLTVRTSLMDFLLPPIGAQRVASNMVKYLSESGLIHNYNKVVFHAFSAGVYQLGEILRVLDSKVDNYSHMNSLIKGLVIDSMIEANGVKGTAKVVSRGITTNTIIQPILQLIIYLYFAISYGFTVNNYRKAMDKLSENSLSLPGLIFYSDNDEISNPKLSRKLFHYWSQSGISVRLKCWPQSKHVLHYRYHTSEYEAELDMFLTKFN